VVRLAAVLVAAVLGLSSAGWDGASASSTAPAVSSYTPVITFRSCGTDQCADFVVPLDWANPDGQKITLAVRVHRATGTSKGILLANPGGPGASGTGLADFLPDNIPGGVGSQYDVVGWDIRGTGDSTPSLHCDSKFFGVDRPDFVPRTHRLMRVWKKKTARYAARCGASTAAAQGLLAHMSTEDNARDMDALREALGAPVLNFYGFSYGTYLGQVYATVFPGRVGLFVLDGVVDPTNYWYGANLKQEIWFDRNLSTFFKWIAQHPSAYHLGRSWRAIRHGYFAQLRRLDRHPAAHGKLGPDELTDAIINAPYYVFNWDYLAYAYSRLVRAGQGGPMFRVYRESNMGDDNGYAVYLGVQCTDAPHPSWRKQRRDAWRIHRKHPYLAWDNTWFNAPCLRWPAPSRTPIAVDGTTTTGKFLLVNETRDAATPYSGALRVRSLFPGSALIAGVGGTTHAGSLSGVGCVDDRIASFLSSGTLPPRLAGDRADVECPAVKPPPAYAGRLAASARLASPASPLPGRDLLAPGWRF
jgi:pimeloyl-ACP methyl ester carboxylesterase